MQSIINYPNYWQLKFNILPILKLLKKFKIDNIKQISYIVFELNIHNIYNHVIFANWNIYQVILGFFYGIAIFTIII